MASNRKRKKQAASPSASAEGPRLVMIVPNNERRIEVVRSFTRKVNLDRFSQAKTYESVDFFASAKSDCRFEERAELSAELYHFVRGEVAASAQEFIAEVRAHQAATGRRELPSIEGQEQTRLGGVS